MLLSEEYEVSISDQIKTLCKECHISHAELSRRLGISPQNLNAKLKRGSFTIKDLEEIAAVTNVSFVRHFILPNGEEI